MEKIKNFYMERLYLDILIDSTVDYMRESKCDILYVIVNNDHQVALKGSKQFMDDNARLNC